MARFERKIAAIHLFLTIALMFSTPLFGRNKNAMDDLTEKKADQIVENMKQEGSSFSLQEIRTIQKHSGLMRHITTRITKLGSEEIEKCLAYMDQLGAQVLTTDNKESLEFAPFIGNEEVIEFLANMLDHKEEIIRSRAVDMLTNNVPDAMLRNYNEKILAAAIAYPATPALSLLIGLTGCESALKLILTNTTIKSYDPHATTLALARLGDWEAQNSLVEHYKKATPGKEKAKAASDLGYIATTAAILALANDFRTDLTYIWREPSARKSFRIDIISALHKAFPRVTVFWPPASKPQNDFYYEKIEKWIITNLGVTWARQRPEFLYEEDAPILPARR